MKRMAFIGSVLLLSGCTHESAQSLSLTHPLIITVLLCIASLSLVFSLFSVSGVAPIIVHLLAISFVYGIFFVEGSLTALAVLMLISGMILLFLELFVPGGIIGTIGFAFIVMSLMSIAPHAPYMLYSILTALIVAVVGMVIMMKFFGKKLNVFNKMVLSDATDTKSGYVSNVNRTELLGQVAITATPLRPSGTAMYGDERLDVVTEGGFIAAGTEVVIIEVEGARIVVRAKIKEA